jgi:H+-translocating NAD(P) transhydrogenase subunit alpha
MIIGVLQEKNDTRVSLIPEQVAALCKNGFTVWVEDGAGGKAFFSDSQYQQQGAVIQARNKILQEANIVLCINRFEEASSLKNKIVLGVYQPLMNATEMEAWKANGNTIYSMDKLPRTTLAQSMDVLSSQANIAGYKAVLQAAQLFPKYFPMFMTAAGSIPPAKVLIIGAGVAGLQAIATAKRLGAVVEVFDTRPAVKEEVQSLGGKFIDVEGAADTSKSGGYAVEQTEEYKQRQQQKINEAVTKADIVITTAQIPGKKAPILINDESLQTMQAGSVIMDLAAVTGGNTSQTKNNETVSYNGVTIVGDSCLQATMPTHASKLYSKNIFNFLALFKTADLVFDAAMQHELIAGCRV